MRSKQIGQLLVESGDASPEQIAMALKTQDAHGGMLGVVLRGMGVCNENAVAQALAKQVQVTEVQCAELTADGSALNGVSKEFCLHEKLCPFEALAGMLCVVMGNPLNRKAVNEIESMTHAKAKAFKAPWHDIQALIERSFDAAQRVPAQDFEPLALDLEGAHAAKSHVQNSAADADPLALDADPDIIPPSDLRNQPAGPTGILEIPLDDEIPLQDELEEEVPAPQVPAKVKPPINPTIKGLESLDSGQAEIFEMTKRPAASSKSGGTAAKSAPAKAPRVAKVNVDLDKFDLQNPSETIDMPARGEHDMMDEIEQNAYRGADARNPDEVLAALKLVPDAYFYSGLAPKNAPRTEELMDIIEALPVAEVLAPNILAYEKSKSGGLEDANDLPADMRAAGSLLSKNHIDIQRAPATPMAALRVGEGEFHKLTLTSSEDPVGEWDWKFTAPGPVAVDPFEE